MGKNSAIACSKSKKWLGSYQISQLFFDLCQLTNTKLNFFEAIVFKFKSSLNRRLSMKTIYLWLKKQLIALSQKNKQNRVLCSILQFQNLLEHFNFQQVSTCASEHKLKLTLFHDSLLMMPATLIKKKMQLCCRWVKLYCNRMNKLLFNIPPFQLVSVGKNWMETFLMQS